MFSKIMTQEKGRGRLRKAYSFASRRSEKILKKRLAVGMFHEKREVFVAGISCVMGIAVRITGLDGFAV